MVGPVGQSADSKTYFRVVGEFVKVRSVEAREGIEPPYEALQAPA